MSVTGTPPSTAPTSASTGGAGATAVSGNTAASASTEATPSAAFDPEFVLNKTTDAMAHSRRLIQQRYEALAKDGKMMSPEEAIHFNLQVSTYNMLAQTAAAVQKEMVDTIKSILSKM